MHDFVQNHQFYSLRLPGLYRPGFTFTALPGKKPKAKPMELSTEICDYGIP